MATVALEVAECALYNNIYSLNLIFAVFISNEIQLQFLGEMFIETEHKIMEKFMQ